MHAVTSGAMRMLPLASTGTEVMASLTAFILSLDRGAKRKHQAEGAGALGQFTRKGEDLPVSETCKLALLIARASMDCVAAFKFQWS